MTCIKQIWWQKKSTTLFPAEFPIKKEEECEAKTVNCLKKIKSASSAKPQISKYHQYSRSKYKVKIDICVCIYKMYACIKNKKFQFCR